MASNLQAGISQPVGLLKGTNINIYIGNLALEVTEDELRQEFTAFGQVLTVTIMDDKYIGSGQPRGYGYVEMPSDSEGKSAIAALNGTSLRQRMVDVIQALPLSNNKGKDSHSGKRGFWFNGKVRQRRY